MAQRVVSRLSDQVGGRVIVGLRKHYEDLRTLSAETKSGEEKKILLEERKKTLVLINDIESGMYDYGLCEKCGKEIPYGLTDKDPLRRVCGTCETEKTLAMLEEKKAVLKQEFDSWRERVKMSLQESTKTIGKDLGDTDVRPSPNAAILNRYYAKTIMADELIRAIRNGDCRYGICDCGEKISKARLQLEPFNNSCIVCLEKKEREAKKVVSGDRFKKPLSKTIKGDRVRPRP